MDLVEEHLHHNVRRECIMMRMKCKDEIGNRNIFILLNIKMVKQLCNNDNTPARMKMLE